MKNIFDSVCNYLALPKTDYALQINGKWGIGKTHYVLNELKPFIEQQVINIESQIQNETASKSKNEDNNNYNFIYISLNGLNNVDEIGERILIANYNTLEAGFAVTKSLIKFGFGVAGLFAPGSVDALSEATEEKRLEIQRNSYKKLNLKKMFLCFDDLERIDSSLKAAEVLGYINTNFVEQAHVKTLIISNQDKMQNEENFMEIKEKVIGRTLTFNRPINDTINSYIDEYYSGDFSLYLKRNLDYINKIIDLIGMNNLRTFRFAMDNLSIVHQSLKDSLFEINPWLKENKDNIYRSILLFTLLISNEYKIGKIKNIKFLEVLNIDGYTRAFLHLRENTDVASIEEKYKLDFLSKYFSKDMESYIYFESIGLLILNGVLVTEQLEKDIKTLIPFFEDAEEALRSLKSYEFLEISDVDVMVDKVFRNIKEVNYSALTLPATYDLINEIYEKGYIDIEMNELKNLILGVIRKSFDKMGGYNLDGIKLNRYFDESIKDENYQDIVDEVKKQRLERLQDENLEEIEHFLLTIGTDEMKENYNKIKNLEHMFNLINTKTNFAKDIVSASNNKILTFSSFLQNRYLNIANANTYYAAEIPHIVTFIGEIQENINEAKPSIDKLKFDNLEILIDKLNSVINHLQK